VKIDHRGNGRVGKSNKDRSFVEGNKTCVYRMHDDGTAEFYRERIELVAWLTQLGYVVYRQRDDLVISIGKLING